MTRLLQVVHANYHHAVELAPNLRESDLRELRAVGHPNPTAVLIEAVDVSTEAFAGIREGQTRLMFGVAPAAPGVGSIWFLASSDIYRWRREFLSESWLWLEYLHAFYGILGNLVDDRHTQARRWLRHLGFIEAGHEPTHGPQGLPFTLFVSER